MVKRRHGLDRAVDVLPRTELEKLHNGSLLTRLKKLRWCEERRDCSDLTDAEVDSVTDKILFKDTEQWRVAYEDVKAVLATRDHVDR